MKGEARFLPGRAVWFASALTAFLLLAGLGVAVPQDGDAGDAFVLDVHLPGTLDRVELWPHDPRTPALAATSPEAAEGLWVGHLQQAGWKLHLVHNEHASLGVLAAPAGAQWVTVEEGAIVPFHPPHMMVDEDESREPATPALDSHAASTSPSPKDGVLQLRLQADHAFYAGWGDEWAAVQLAITDLVGAIFESNLGVRFEVVEQNAWTTEEEDPLDPKWVCSADNQSTVLLDQYRNHMESVARTTENVWELSHLFSGRWLSGSTIGCAYIAALDTSWAYGTSLVRAPTSSPNLYRHVVLVAHEIGHNFNGVHFEALGEDCAGGTIMYPTLCANTPVFGGFEQVLPCRLGLPGCPIIYIGNGPRMWGYAHDRI